MDTSYRNRFGVDVVNPAEVESGDPVDNFLAGKTADECLERLVCSPFGLEVEYSGAGGGSNGVIGDRGIDGAGRISGLRGLSSGCAYLIPAPDPAEDSACGGRSH